jgi:hypothetical protein
MIEREEQELTDAMREVIASDAGKRVIFWILEQAAIYRDAYAGENAATNYVLGSQAVGRRLIERMDMIDGRLYPRLLLDMADLREMDRAAERKQGEDENVD